MTCYREPPRREPCSRSRTGSRSCTCSSTTAGSRGARILRRFRPRCVRCDAVRGGAATCRRASRPSAGLRVPSRTCTRTSPALTCPPASPRPPLPTTRPPAMGSRACAERNVSVPVDARPAADAREGRGARRPRASHQHRQRHGHPAPARAHVFVRRQQGRGAQPDAQAVVGTRAVDHRQCHCAGCVCLRRLRDDVRFASRSLP